MSKYRAERTSIDGIKFQSKREAQRYVELKLLKRAGKIQDLKLQPAYKFPIMYDSGRHIFYRADFKYFDGDTAKVIVEDVKGMRTQVYKIKKAMMFYFHGIEIVEI